MRLAHAKGLASICHDTLCHVSAQLGTSVAPSLLNVLETDEYEPIKNYLNASKTVKKWHDFSAVGGVKKKLSFGRELFFSDSEYLRAEFGQSNSIPLFHLYAKRTLRGIPKHLTLH